LVLPYNDREPQQLSWLEKKRAEQKKQ